MPPRPVLRILVLFSILVALVRCAAAQQPVATAWTAPFEAPPPPLDVASWGRAVTAPPGATILVFTDPGEVPHLEVAGEGRALPLEHTGVRANVRGGVAELEVTQTYQNPSDKPIEAVYVFPLPENSAVYSMRMRIGERVIEAEVRERKIARAVYEAAKNAGHTAALLEQERPNVFTQSVANLEPGKKIDVVIRYVQDLTYDAGQYEFVFPMVVGPRYTAGTPDAARISPPVMGTGERTGSDVSVEVNVEPGPAVTDIEVPTHEVAKTLANGALRVALTEKQAIPNRDFVLRWRVVDARPKARLLLSEPTDGAGYFSLLVHPPQLPVDDLVGRREIIFVVDVSGSMSGVPLALCQQAMREALVSLRPVDTFNIITFAGSTGQAFKAPRAANSASIRDAMDFVNGMTAGGGTVMAGAVEAALRPDVEPGRNRYVFFLTDGYIGGEAQIFAGAKRLVAGLEAKGQKARVFGMGIGSSPNRNLIEGLSLAGKGLATYAGTREDPARAVNKIYHYIDRAVLTEVKPDLAALGAAEVFPAEIPDLFASHPIVLHGVYKKLPEGPVVVRAKAGNETVEIPVEVRRSVGSTMGTLGRLWARAKVASLEEQRWIEGNPAAEKAITDLGLRFHLVTPFTSLIAVDWSKKVGDGNPEKVVQPVDAPEGVDPEMAGGQVIGMPPALNHRIDRSLAGASEVVVISGRPGCYCRAFAGQGESPAGGLAAVAMLVLVCVARRQRRAA